MRMLYVANARIPTEKAHGLQIMKMCAEFARKLDVTLAVPIRFQTRLMKQVTDVYDYYAVEKKFGIKRLFSLNLTPALDSRLSYRTQWLQNWLNWLPSITFGIVSAVYALARSASLVYSREFLTCLFLLLLRPLHRKRIFYEMHDFPEAKLGRQLKCRSMRRFDGLIVIGGLLRELCLSYNIPSEKILVAPDGVDMQLFSADIQRERARQELNISVGKRVLCYTGHLYRWKGVHVLAQAMKALPEDSLLYIVGGTPKDISAFGEFINAENIPNVVIAGYVSPKSIPVYLAAADVLVLPNTAGEAISRLYTSPLKLFEYMAAGRPVVASDLPSVREIMSEANAILVPPDNPAALAEGIRRVLEDKELGRKLAQQAFEDAQLYTWEKRAEKIMAFIGEKCSSGTSSSRTVSGK